MGIKYSQSESKELMKKLLANVAVADNCEPKLREEAKIEYKKTPAYKTDLEKIRGGK